ncbi:MAG: DUF885 domain-containing protein [Burkholderiales bacterium]|nr:DUF885 domain-containing protein [Burkholderiales bacterium]
MPMTRLGACAALLALAPFALAAQPAWVQRSDAIALPILNTEVKFNPEFGSEVGQESFDTEVMDLAPQRYERRQAAAASAMASLEQSLAAETDPKVRQDIQILIHQVKQNAATEQVEHANLLGYIDVSQVVYEGLRSLLDPRNKPARQAKALVRLNRYAGLEAGYRPMVDLARARMQERFDQPGLVGPYDEDVKQSLENADFYLKGIAELFKKDKIQGWEAPYAKLSKQLHDYAEWSRQNVMPRARKEATQPKAVYINALREDGVDISPEELIERASADYQEVRDQMQTLSKRIAERRHLPSGDYRDVLSELKKDQIEPIAMLPLYWKRLREIEAIIREHHLVTLPTRDANIRVATEAEAAQAPAPFMLPPRFIGNTGEFGEFVIPLANPHAKTAERLDDFTTDAVAWTLASHEARPGHELQFAAMVEQGTSLSRGLFAFNSTNVEGWALYCEAMMLPYMPEEGQLFSLQLRLQRMARAFLDPMVNLGRITPAQAKQFLMQEVRLSEPMAQQEVDRYAFNSPGQATTYYYGYIKLRALRSQAEMALGKQFDLQAFNDFVIAQGMLPPQLLTDAVMNEFVAPRVEKTKLAAATVK